MSSGDKRTIWLLGLFGSIGFLINGTTGLAIGLAMIFGSKIIADL